MLEIGHNGSSAPSFRILVVDEEWVKLQIGDFLW